MKNKIDKKKYLVNILKKVLEANIEIMTYYKFIASDDKSKKVCSKSIKQSKLAIEKLTHTKHIEILVSLYNTIVAGKEVVFVSGGSLICSKQFDRWDKTEKGFKEFLALEEENRKVQKEKIEEQRKTQEMVAKAKEEGKEVEMVYDNGKLKPVIKEKSNA